MARPPIQRVTLADLRELFNHEVLPRILSGELLEIVRSEGQPNPRMHQVPGTRSQIVEYWESTGQAMQKVALCHRYLRPDGTLGGRDGRPDPKSVLHEGVIYAPYVKPPAS